MPVSDAPRCQPRAGTGSSPSYSTAHSGHHQPGIFPAGKLCCMLQHTRMFAASGRVCLGQQMLSQHHQDTETHACASICQAHTQPCRAAATCRDNNARIPCAGCVMFFLAAYQHFMWLLLSVCPAGEVPHPGGESMATQQQDQQQQQQLRQHVAAMLQPFLSSHANLQQYLHEEALHGTCVVLQGDHPGRSCHALACRCGC